MNTDKITINYDEEAIKKNVIKYSKAVFFFMVLILTIFRDILIYLFDGSSANDDDEVSVKDEPTMYDKSIPGSEDYDVFYDPSYNEGASYGWTHDFYDQDK